MVVFLPVHVVFSLVELHLRYSSIRSRGTFGVVWLIHVVSFMTGSCFQCDLTTKDLFQDNTQYSQC